MVCGYQRDRPLIAATFPHKRAQGQHLRVEHDPDQVGLILFAAAIRAIDTAGFEHACISSHLAASSYFRRPSRLRPTTRRAVAQIVLFVQYTRPHVVEHGHVSSEKLLARRKAPVFRLLTNSRAWMQPSTSHVNPMNAVPLGKCFCFLQSRKLSH